MDSLSSASWTEVIFACFSLSGKTPVCIDLLNISASGSDMQFVTCLISLIENPSIPTPSLFDKLPITVYISLAVQGTAKNEIGFGAGIVSFIDAPGALGEIFWQDRYQH